MLIEASGSAALVLVLISGKATVDAKCDTSCLSVAVVSCVAWRNQFRCGRRSWWRSSA